MLDFGVLLTGYSGIILLLWMYILAARPLIGIFTRDLASMHEIHKLLGKFGFVLFALHPLIADLLNIEEPGFDIFKKLGEAAFWLLVFTIANSVILKKIITFRLWKYAHYLNYIILPFALLHSIVKGNLFSYNYLSQLTYIVVFLTIIIMIIKLVEFLGIGKYSYRIKSNKLIATDVYELTLAPIRKSLKAQLGQYIYLYKTDLIEPHPFSIININDKDEITIAYKVFGSFTRSLSQSLENEIIKLNGPWGKFTTDIKKHTYPVVFIAGGIGVTPFAQQIIDIKNSGRDILMFYANRDSKSAAYETNISAKLGAQYISLYGAPSNNTRNINQEIGYLNKDIIHKYIKKPKNYHYYICGPKPMMDSSIQILKDLSVPELQIHTEKFSS